MELYKYQGAGNDFLIIDNRDGAVIHGGASASGGILLSPAGIAELCDRRYGIGADGLMLLERAEDADFRMVYYNSDGSGGMMCGNGGRCIAAFADMCGVSGLDFVAADGLHSASILSKNGRTCTVRLKMKDVEGIDFYAEDGLMGSFLDTGTKHFVMQAEELQGYDVYAEGRRIRYREEFSPTGTNVNFVEPCGRFLCVRTYEKGVEDETFACGTGITASAIAVWHRMAGSPDMQSRYGDVFRTAGGERVHADIKALRDLLAVDFIPVPGGASDVWLTGPAAYVCKIII